MINNPLNYSDSDILLQIAKEEDRLTRITDKLAIKLTRQSVSDWSELAISRGLDPSAAVLPDVRAESWKTYEDWQAMGRQVRKGQSGTSIEGVNKFEFEQTDARKFSVRATGEASTQGWCSLCQSYCWGDCQAG